MEEIENENLKESGRLREHVSRVGLGLRRIFRLILVLIVLAGAGYAYVNYFFVFGSGVKTGTLNYVVNKGFVFKTYEGELILSGMKSKSANSFQSNEFLFSIESEEIALELMHMGGKEVELHYKEYLKAIPWRGYQKYVVDSIQPSYPKHATPERVTTPPAEPTVEAEVEVETKVEPEAAEAPSQTTEAELIAI